MTLLATYDTPSGIVSAATAGSAGVLTDDVGLVSQWSDGTSTNHITQSTDANKPRRFNEQNSGLIFDWVNNVANLRYMAIPAGITASLRNFGLFGVWELHSSRPNTYSGSAPAAQLMSAMTLDSTGDMGLNFRADSLTVPGYLQVFDSSATRNSTLPPRISRSFFGLIGNSSNYRLFLNRQSELLSTAPTNESFTGGRLGNFVSATTGPFYGRFRHLRFYDATPTTTEIDAIRQSLYETYSIPTSEINILIEGDSIGQGQAATLNRSWARRLVENNPTWQIANTSISGGAFATGSNVYNMTTNFATRTSPFFVYGAKNILICTLGVNELLNQTASTAWTNAVTYCTAAKAVGWTVILATATTHGSYDYTTKTKAYNDLLKAGWYATGVIDDIIDHTVDTRLVSDGADDNANYFSDVVHWTAAGHGLAYQNIQPVVARWAALPTSYADGRVHKLSIGSAGEVTTTVAAEDIRDAIGLANADLDTQLDALASQTSVDDAQTDIDTLLSRLSATRAGYLDNLNTGGVVASQADITAINQSASRRVTLATLAQYERPESGSTVYLVEARTFDGDGAPANDDSAPTLAVTGQTTGDLSANLGTVNNPATGVYRAEYTVENNATLEPIWFDFTTVIGGSTFTMRVFSQVCDFVAATFTTTDRANIEAVKAKTDNLPASPAATGDIPTAAQNRAEMDSNSTVLAAAAADALLARKLIEADKYVDVNTTPWQLVHIEKGTGAIGVGTELLRQDIKSTAGVNLTAETTVVGQLVVTS